MSLNHQEARKVMDAVEAHVEPFRPVDKFIIIFGSMTCAILLVVLAAPSKFIFLG